ncbi:MAG: 4Fe-4S binding protein [Candidatus Marinimicrobia bacterium]|nr:4Fe-4S binding protein [Candidatus Neomarinimicrobiota bacterium]MCF7850975.1 4Fe-4S binding protein [Candidatus Neomarinimicrobiota bacterium]MCF7905552.1 4Fe-4S binding protein [Candidatus Neomarinimicrobiota bacterium]
MILVQDNRCDLCGTCVAVCPVDAIEVREADISIIHDKCIDCDICIWVCPIDVLSSDQKVEVTNE